MESALKIFAVWATLIGGGAVREEVETLFGNEFLQIIIFLFRFVWTLNVLLK